jgi:predicted RNase H-like HicB family nuclease
MALESPAQAVHGILNVLDRFAKCVHSALEKSKMRYRVLIEQDEDGVYVAEAPALPGCVSQGKTRDEAIKNIEEAIVAYLESLEAHGDPIPPSISEEVIEVNP